MIQEFSYIIQQHRFENFYTYGPKYDRRIAVCVGSKGMEEIPAYYLPSRLPEAVIHYKDETRLSFYLKKLTNRSKLLLLGHGGEAALHEKSGATKPDFSVAIATHLLTTQAPQLRDPEGGAPSQLFKISLISCRALRYGLELSRSLAEAGISNQITARTLKVQFGNFGRKETLLGTTPKHRFTGSKLLITTYAQCPALSQLEFVNYQHRASNQFVWIPRSVKPLQQVDLPDRSLNAYESLFRALDMIGMKVPPLSLLYDALENTEDKEVFYFLSSVFFSKTEFGSDRLRVFLEYAFKNSLKPDHLSMILQTAYASLPATTDTWVKFAIDHKTDETTLRAFLQNVCSLEKRTSYLESDTVAYAIEKNVSTCILQTLLSHVNASSLVFLTRFGLEKAHPPDVLTLLFQERASSRHSMPSSSFDPSVVSEELLQQIKDKKLAPSLLKAIIPYLHPREIEILIEKGIFRKIEDAQLELILATNKQTLKLNAILLLQTDSPFLQKLLLPHVQMLPESIMKKKLLLKKYPELKKLIKTTRKIPSKSSSVGKLKSKTIDFS